MARLTGVGKRGIRGFDFWKAISLWVSAGASGAVPSEGQVGRARPPIKHRPPSLELLESRDTVSDTVLGVLGTAVLGATALRMPGPANASTFRTTTDTRVVLSAAAPSAPSAPATSRWDWVRKSAEPADRAPAASFPAITSPAHVGEEEIADVFAPFLPGLDILEEAKGHHESPSHPFQVIEAEAPTSGMRDAGGVGITAPSGPGEIQLQGPGNAGLSGPTTAPALNAQMLLGGFLGQVGIGSLPSKSNGQGAPPPGGGGFEVSWQAGGYDANGTYMGATELMYLVAHNGKLFGATSVWEDVPGNDPDIGAEIIRLDGPDQQWVVDYAWDKLLAGGRPRDGRVEALQEVTFTTDGNGNALPQPVSILLAAPDDGLGPTGDRGRLLIYSRNDDTGTWDKMVLGHLDTDGRTRSIGFHHDPITGVDYVFAGTNAGVYSGVYDPTVRGRIRWSSQPEFVYSGRAMSFAEVNGVLSVAVQPNLYVRHDGPAPYWQTVLSYPPPPPLAEGLRALTPIPAPNGIGQVLLAGYEGIPPQIVRIIPLLGYNYVIDLDVGSFLSKIWGSDVRYAVPGYNSMPAVVDPRTGEQVRLIGLLAYAPEPHDHSSWYLIRHDDGRYDLREILPQPTPTDPDPHLYGCRTIVVSPFPEDKGQVVYFGGYDSILLPAHNTAWIYRAPVTTVLDGE